MNVFPHQSNSTAPYNKIIQHPTFTLVTFQTYQIINLSFHRSANNDPVFQRVDGVYRSTIRVVSDQRKHQCLARCHKIRSGRKYF
jgi:hypothetical protein